MSVIGDFAEGALGLTGAIAPAAAGAAVSNASSGGFGPLFQYLGPALSSGFRGGIAAGIGSLVGRGLGGRAAGGAGSAAGASAFTQGQDIEYRNAADEAQRRLQRDIESGKEGIAREEMRSREGTAALEQGTQIDRTAAMRADTEARVKAEWAIAHYQALEQMKRLNAELAAKPTGLGIASRRLDDLGGWVGTGYDWLKHRLTDYYKGGKPGPGLGFLPY